MHLRCLMLQFLLLVILLLLLLLLPLRLLRLLLFQVGAGAEWRTGWKMYRKTENHAWCGVQMIRLYICIHIDLLHVEITPPVPGTTGMEPFCFVAGRKTL